MKNKVAQKQPSSAKEFVTTIKEVWMKEISIDRQTDTQNLFCPKPYKTITKKYNAKKKGQGSTEQP